MEVPTKGTNRRYRWTIPTEDSNRSVARLTDRGIDNTRRERTTCNHRSSENRTVDCNRPTVNLQQITTDRQSIHNQPTVERQSINDEQYEQSYEYEHERECDRNRVYSNGCTACRVRTARPIASRRATETASANASVNASASANESANASGAAIARTIASAIANVADSKNHPTRTNLRIRLDHLDQLDRRPNDRSLASTSCTSYLPRPRT